MLCCSNRLLKYLQHVEFVSEIMPNQVFQKHFELNIKCVPEFLPCKVLNADAAFKWNL